MAYYEENEDELNQQDPNAQAGGGIATSKESATISGTPGAGAAPQTPGGTPTPDKPGNFVGISQYLNANKNQANKLADQTAGVISNSADQARQGVNQLNEDFNKKAGSTLQVDQDALNKLNYAPQSLSSEQKANIKNAASAEYKGPKDLTESDLYGTANEKLSTARQNIDNAGSEQGRMGLVKNINQGYRNQGIDTFDNALLQTGAGREKIDQAAAQNQDLKQDVLGQNNLQAQQKASDLANSYKNTQTQTQGALQSARQGIESGVNQKLQSAIEKALGANNRVTQDISDLNLDNETIDMLGLTPGSKTYGLNLADYLTQADPTSLKAGNVADDSDYARYAALSELAGIPQDQMLFDPSKRQDMSGMNLTPSFDKARLQADVEKNAFQDYNNNKNFMPSSNINSDNIWNKYSSATNGGMTGSINRETLPDGIGKVNYDSLSPKQLEEFIPTLEKNAKLTGDPGSTMYQVGAFARDVLNKAQKKLNDWKNAGKIQANQTYTPKLTDDSGYKGNFKK